MSSAWVKLVLIISTVGQVFCGMACLTSASRMCYAFSRDGAIPGWRIWSRVNERRIPFNAVHLHGRAAPASSRSPPPSATAEGIPVAFFAVVSIAVIGLYIAYVIPIYLRWRMGDTFEAGPWTNGAQVQVDEPVRDGLGGADHDHLHPADDARGRSLRATSSSWNAVNYAPLVTGGVILAVGDLVARRAPRKTFTGPRHTIAELDAELGEGPSAAAGPRRSSRLARPPTGRRACRRPTA